MRDAERIIIPEGAHSVLGPSSAERWINCPGSVLLPGVAPATEYAAEGTAAHTLSEYVRTQNRDPAEWKGKVLVVGEYEFKVGKNMIDSVRRFVADVAAEGAPHRLAEEMVAYEELVPGGFGTTDHAGLWDRLCSIKDYKHGKGVVVGARDNPQLMLYALGVWFKYRWIFEFDTFKLSICQPRVQHFDETEISLGRLLQWGYDVIRPAAALALTPGAPFKAGSWCKFCKAKDTCSTRAAYKAQYERSPDTAENAFVDLTKEDPFK